VSPLEQDLFFELPGANTRWFPIWHSDQPISFGFIEVGCQPHSKRKQLRDDRDGFREFWNREYRQKLSVPWFPKVHRTLIHYDPRKFAKGVFNRQEEFNPDVVIYVHYIPEEALETLTYHQIESVLRECPGQTRPELEKLIQDKDTDRIRHLITEQRSVQRYTGFRGRIAEVVALGMVRKATPVGMNLSENSDIRLFRNRVDSLGYSSEIDGVAIYHGTQSYRTLIENLSTKPYLKVELEKSFRE
jgi:hypothetical protein